MNSILPEATSATILGRESSSVELAPAGQKPLIDGFGRHIDYARLSLTDRCDFRCVYCMAEDMKFLPRKEILALEELLLVAQALVATGIRKIRLTGGEPLIRKNMLWLVEQLNRIEQLDEITLTTNGSQLEKLADQLSYHGVRRINISLDSLNAEKFTRITRTGQLSQVLQGIRAAKRAGFESIKLNSVILKNHNDDEILNLLEYALANDLDISFIEEMPLGVMEHRDRAVSFCASDYVKSVIESEYKLEDSDKKTNGPSRYCKVAGSNTHVGFISPHSNNFCAQCNRIRVTVEGRLLLCLGNEDSLDLRELIRDKSADSAELQQAIRQALEKKPLEHHFDLNEKPDIVRFMNTTGG